MNDREPPENAFLPPHTGNLGWDALGTILLGDEALIDNASNNSFNGDDAISSHLELGDMTISLRFLFFEISNDGIHSDRNPQHRRINYSVMGLRIQFTVDFDQPIYIIVKYSSPNTQRQTVDGCAPAPVDSSTLNSPDNIIKKCYSIHKIEITNSRRSLTQIVKIYNAYYGQKYEIFLVGTKGSYAMVNDISIDAFPVDPQIAIQLYDGKTTIAYDKVFDIMEFEKLQIIHFLKFLKRFSKMILTYYDDELAEDFVDYCQQRYFCDSCALKSELDRRDIINLEVQRDRCINYLKFHYCSNEDCVSRIIRDGDYRHILEDPNIRRMIIIKQEELQPSNSPREQRGRPSVYFNINKWKWREAKVERRKRKAIIEFEREQYEKMADCFKLFCLKCNTVEPFLDARSRRIFKETEEERLQQSLKMNKPFVPRFYETKCSKCRSPYVNKQTVDPTEWNQRMILYSNQKEIELTLLKQQYEKPKSRIFWQDFAFSKNMGASLSETKSFLLKDLTKEGIDVVFHMKRKRKHHSYSKVIKKGNKIVTFDDECILDDEIQNKVGDEDEVVVVPDIVYENNFMDFPNEEGDITTVDHTVSVDIPETEIVDENNICETLGEMALQDEWDMAQLIRATELFQPYSAGSSNHHSCVPKVNFLSSSGSQIIKSELQSSSGAKSPSVSYSGGESSALTTEEIRRSKARRPSSLPIVSVHKVSSDSNNGPEVNKENDLQIDPALMSYVQYGLTGGSGNVDDLEHSLPPKRLSDKINRVMSTRLDKMFLENPLENSDQGKSLHRSAYVWKSGLAGIFPLDLCSEVMNSEKDLLLVRITCIFDEKLSRYRIFDPNSLLDIQCPTDSLLDNSAVSKDGSSKVSGNRMVLSQSRSGRHNAKRRLNVEIRYFFGVCRGGSNKAGQFVIPLISSEDSSDICDEVEDVLDPMEKFARGFEMQHHKRCEYLCAITATSEHANSHAASMNHTTESGLVIPGFLIINDAYRMSEREQPSARSNISFNDSILEEIVVAAGEANGSSRNENMKNMKLNRTKQCEELSSRRNDSNLDDMQHKLPPSSNKALSWKIAAKISDFNDNFYLPENAIFSINRISVKHIPRNATWCAHSHQRDIKGYVHELQFPVRMFDELTLDVCYGYFSLYSTAVKFALKELDDSCPSMQFSVKEAIYALEDHVFSRVLSKPWNTLIGAIPEHSVALFILHHEVSILPLGRVEFLCDNSQNKEFI